MCGADAKSKIAAGADLVQIYTGLIYQGAPLVRDARRGQGLSVRCEATAVNDQRP